MPLALEVLDRPQAAVPQLLLHDDGHERVARPLAALVGHDPELLAAQHDVVERGGEAGRAHVELARGQRGGDGRRGLEVDQLRLDAELLEVALLDPDEDRRRGRELEHADLHRCGRAARAIAPPRRATSMMPPRERGRGQDQSGESRRMPEPPLRCAASGSPRARARESPQCDRTPSSESTTMPTMSLVVSIRLPRLEHEEADARRRPRSSRRPPAGAARCRRPAAGPRRPWAAPRAG